MKSIRNGDIDSREEGGISVCGRRKETRRLTIHSKGKTNVVVDTLGDSVGLVRWLPSVSLRRERQRKEGRRVSEMSDDQTSNGREEREERTTICSVLVWKG